MPILETGAITGRCPAVRLASVEKGTRFCFRMEQITGRGQFLKLDGLSYLAPSGVVCHGDGDQTVFPLSCSFEVGDFRRPMGELQFGETFIFEPGAGEWYTRCDQGYVDAAGDVHGLTDALVLVVPVTIHKAA